MVKRLDKQRFLYIALSCYLLVVFIISILQYFHSKQSFLADIDQQLARAAVMADNILLRSMTYNIAGQHHALSFDEDYLLALELSALAEQFDVEYVYSMRAEGSGIVFITSSLAPEETSREKYEPVYLTPYAEAPIAIYTAIGFAEPQVYEYEDRWGKFRSFFLPSADQEGMPYVIGVDISLEKVSLAAFKSALIAFAYAVLLVLIIAPIVLLYIRLLKRRHREQLNQLEVHPVTGLYNKRRLIRRIERCASTNHHLLLVRIENLQDIINVNGIAFGDELLLRITYALRDLPVSGIEYCELYHVDENMFGLYAEALLTREQQVDVVGETFKTLTKFQVTSGAEQSIPLLLRMAAASGHDDIYALANMALSYALMHNKTFVEYEPTLALPEYFQRHLDAYSQLNHALVNNTVRVFYQPIVDISTGQMLKCEALLRIFNDQGEHTVMPEQFMPLAYQSRLCHKLTRLVLDTVIEDVRTHDMPISINLSVKDLFDQATREYIIKKLRHHGIGSKIGFELLEQQRISQYQRAAAYIRQLKSCGSVVGIDDLGKLYSNTDRLLELPLDFLKIDGALIESIVENEESRAIVTGMVNFAKHRKMQVIAEFCSSADVCKEVKALGITVMQGFYLCPPQSSIAEAKAYLATRDSHLLI